MTQSDLASDVVDRSHAAEGKHVVFFDGVCGLCNKSVQFILDNDAKEVFYFAALQSAFASQILSPYKVDPTDLDSVRVLANYKAANERLYERSDAALFVLRQLGGWRGQFGHLTFIPGFIRDSVYKLIAAVRYKLFGKYDSCRLPDPATRARFIEV
jgi:predicted DCC family thiol-disulfide oxidoreductase YuxK